MLDRKAWNTLKIKVPTYFILLTIIPFAITAIIYYQSTKHVLSEQKVGDLMNLIDTKYIHTLDFFHKERSDIQLLASSKLITNAVQDYGSDGFSDEASDYLANIVEKNKLNAKHPFNRDIPTRNRYDEAFVVSASGKIIYSTNPNNIGKDVGIQKVFTVGTIETRVLDAERNGDGKAHFTVVTPIMVNNKVVGVLGRKIDVAFLQLLISGELGNLTGGKLFFAGFGETMDFYFMNKQGMMVNQSRVLKHDTVLKEKGSTFVLDKALYSGSDTERLNSFGASTGVHEAMDIYENEQGETVAGASMVIFDNPFLVMVAEQNVNEIFAPINGLARMMLLLGLLYVLIVSTLSVMISRSFTGRLSKVRDTISLVAQGDLEHTVADAGDDELSDVAKSVNIMIKKIKPTISDVQVASLRIADASTDVKKTVDFIEDTSQQVATSVALISDGLNSQSTNTADISSLVTKITSSMETVAKNAQNESSELSGVNDLVSELDGSINNLVEEASKASSRAVQSSDAAASSMETIENVLGKFQNIFTLVNGNAERISTLGERSKAIGEIIKVIDDLADQTNLLALNAAIEAARAGEHGKGFAVVADEVRKLAERSTHATKEISELILSVQRQTEEAVIAIKESAVEIQTGGSMAKDAGSVLGAIVTSAEETTAHMEHVANSARGIINKSNKVHDTVQKVAGLTSVNAKTAQEVADSLARISENILNISAITEQNSAATQEVLASTEEQVALITQLATAAADLSIIAKALAGKSAQFSVGNQNTVISFKTEEESMKQLEEKLSLNPRVKI